jgi:hypothetical protein
MPQATLPSAVAGTSGCPLHERLTPETGQLSGRQHATAAIRRGFGPGRHQTGLEERQGARGGSGLLSGGHQVLRLLQRGREDLVTLASAHPAVRRHRSQRTNLQPEVVVPHA